MLENRSKIQVLTTELNELKGKQFTYDNICKDPESFASYTGISVEKFDVFFSFLNPGTKSENMKLYEAAKRQSEDNGSQRIAITGSQASFTEGSIFNQAQNPD